MGALINKDGTAKPGLIDLVFRDLAAVHGVTVDWLKQYYTGEYFAWDWSRDLLTMGLPFLPVAILTLLNGRFRWIRVLWSRFVRRRRRLQPNAPTRRKRQALLRRRGDQYLSCVFRFTFDSLSVLLTRTLLTAGLSVLWKAHGVPLTNTFISTNLRAFRRRFGGCGVRPSTWTKNPSVNWSHLTRSSWNDSL